MCHPHKVTHENRPKIVSKMVKKLATTTQVLGAVSELKKWQPIMELSSGSKLLF